MLESLYTIISPLPIIYTLYTLLLAAGTIMLVSSATGALFAGYIVKRYRLSASGVIKMTNIVLFLSVPFLSLLMLICSDGPVTGLDASQNVR